MRNKNSINLFFESVLPVTVSLMTVILILLFDWMITFILHHGTRKGSLKQQFRTQYEFTRLMNADFQFRICHRVSNEHDIHKLLYIHQLIVKTGQLDACNEPIHLKETPLGWKLLWSKLFGKLFHGSSKSIQNKFMPYVWWFLVWKDAQLRAIDDACE